MGFGKRGGFQNLKRERRNDYVEFSDKITITSDLTQAVQHADVMVISISSQALSGFMQSLSKENLDGKAIVLCMKGIEETTGRRLTEIVGDYVDTKRHLLLFGSDRVTHRTLFAEYQTVW